jgi:hypothetical protein
MNPNEIKAVMKETNKVAMKLGESETFAQAMAAGLEDAKAEIRRLELLQTCRERTEKRLLDTIETMEKEIDDLQTGNQMLRSEMNFLNMNGSDLHYLIRRRVQDNPEYLADLLGQPLLERMYQGQKIDAIKMVRALLKTGLKEAKELVESLQDRVELDEGIYFVAPEVGEETVQDPVVVAINVDETKEEVTQSDNGTGTK